LEFEQEWQNLKMCRSRVFSAKAGVESDKKILDSVLHCCTDSIKDPQHQQNLALQAMQIISATLL